MAGEIKVNVEAGPFVRMMLRDLGPRAVRSSVMAGIRDATRFLQRALRARMPKRSGRSRRLIVARRVRQSGPVFAGGVNRPIILNILESGAKAHEIIPRRKGALLLAGEQADALLAGRVRHPGIAARPFWEQTAMAGEPEALRVFNAKIEDMIRKAQARR